MQYQKALSILENAVNRVRETSGFVAMFEEDKGMVDGADS